MTVWLRVGPTDLVAFSGGVDSASSPGWPPTCSGPTPGGDRRLPVAGPRGARRLSGPGGRLGAAVDRASRPTSWPSRLPGQRHRSLLALQDELMDALARSPRPRSAAVVSASTSTIWATTALASGRHRAGGHLPSGRIWLTKADVRGLDPPARAGDLGQAGLGLSGSRVPYGTPVTLGTLPGGEGRVGLAGPRFRPVTRSPLRGSGWHRVRGEDFGRAVAPAAGRGAVRGRPGTAM